MLMVYTLIGAIVIIVLIGIVSKQIRRKEGSGLKKFLLTACLVILVFMLIGLLNYAL